jgi:hypothetical protein
MPESVCADTRWLVTLRYLDLLSASRLEWVVLARRLELFLSLTMYVPSYVKPEELESNMRWVEV